MSIHAAMLAIPLAVAALAIGANREIAANRVVRIDVTEALRFRFIAATHAHV